MAVQDVDPSHDMTLKLEELLQRASSIKRQTTIDPPLQVSELAEVDEPLLGAPPGDSEVHKTTIEVAARHVFYTILAATPIDDPAFVQMWNLLDILQYCGDRDQCSPQLILLLIEELLDSQSTDGCRIVFNFLESRREVLIANNSRNKDLVILRSCNELLRRLSRAEDAVFCGRVYIFLFQSFPLGDKSSVNLRGDFHVENVTTFDDYLQESVREGENMEVDDSNGKEAVKQPEEDISMKTTKPETSDQAGKKPTTLDIDDLYPVFWSLQYAFSNPVRLFEEENFNEFKKGLEATITKFKEVPKVIQASNTEGKRGTKRKAGEDYDEFSSTFNPKYLTSRDLFKLELSDLAFQRHILVQALILIDFLSSLTEKSKKKPYYLNAQKALQYSFMLREQDAEWALGIKNTIANYLQDGPDGKFYYRMVDTVLSRDKNWVRWKMESCQPFTRDRVPTKDFPDAKSGAQRASKIRTTTRPRNVNLNLSFLSDTLSEKGLERLKQGDRHAVPSAELYAREVDGIDLDMEMAFTEEEKRNLGEAKETKTWRALRIAAKDRLRTFDKFEEGKSLGKLFQPDGVNEAAVVEDNAASAPESRDTVPPEHPSVEEGERPGQQSQLMAETAAE